MSTSENELPEQNVDPLSQESEEQGLPALEQEEVALLSDQPAHNLAKEQNEAESRPLSMEDLPPEAQGETNGGPLGCCLGVMVGVVLSLSIAIISRVYPDLFVTIFGEHISIITRVLMTILLIAGAILFGGVGWRLGLRFYREYEPSPRYKRKMAALEARQQAIDRRRARRDKSAKRSS